MKSNEYMIGDWVYDKAAQNNYQIAGLSSNKVRLYTESYTPFKRISQVSPIPITKEILEKNEWRIKYGYAHLKLDECRTLQYYFYEHRLRMWHEGIDEWNNHSLVKEIMFQCYPMYVHELQHAFKLSGIDKTNPSLLESLNKSLK